MGNYATTAELTARFESSADLAHLTDSVDDGAASETVLAEVLNDAEGEVNSYLAKRYYVPVNVSTDAVLAARLKSLTLDLAVWRLCVRGDFASEIKNRARDGALEYLKGIAAGELLLPSTATLAGSSSDEPEARWGIGGSVISGSSQRVFTREDASQL